MTIPNTPVGTDTDMFGEIANWAWEIQGRINRKETKIRYFKIKQRFICLKLFNFQIGYLNFKFKRFVNPNVFELFSNIL